MGIMETAKETAGIAQESLRTQRFPSYLIGLGALISLGVLAFVLKVEAGLAAAVMGAITALVSSTVVAGNVHDMRVRESMVDPSGPTAPVTVNQTSPAAPGVEINTPPKSVPPSVPPSMPPGPVVPFSVPPIG